jgi:hypothetical protein
MNKPGDSSNAHEPRKQTREELHIEERVKRTPATDMQTEDAGTADSGVDTTATAGSASGSAGGGSGANDASNARPDSGNSGATSSGTSAEGAMKQTSKTAAERGSR